MEEQSALQRLSQKVSQIVQDMHALKEENELLRNEVVTLRAQNETKDLEIERLGDENSLKDIEIEEIVNKIESILS